MLEIQDYTTIQQLVDDELDHMIQNISKLFEETEKKDTKPVFFQQINTSQFTNFIAVTRDTNSVESIITWIQFQIGRARPNEGWRYADFGDKVIKQIQQYDNQARDIAGDNKGFHRALRMQLVRQYAGQLYRYFYYRDSVSNPERRG